MVGGNPENKLEIEGVELCDEEEDGDAEDGHPPLEAGQGVPGELYPPVRRELTKESFDFTTECWDLIQSSPVVGLHSQISMEIYFESQSQVSEGRFQKKNKKKLRKVPLTGE